MLKQKIMNQLIADTEGVLAKYDWDYDHETMKLIAQEWAINKTKLRELFSKHPYWIEEKQYIVFENDYERKRDDKAIEDFRYWLIGKVEEISIVDYIPNVETYAGWDTYNGFFIRKVIDILLFPEDAENTCNEQQEYILNKVIPELKCKQGQKISRIINKICKKLKLDQCSDYNQEFAKFSDALNPIKYKRYTIISINMIDYLLSSNGNSWSSCHTIDTHQKYQSDFRGESCSGTMSYMLDKTSFVMYTVDSKYNGKDYELQPKVNRQMFQYDDFKLLQGRLYPQCNDGKIGDDLRTDFRNIVQKVVADCLERPNLWLIKPSSEYPTCEQIVYTPYATHYPDYNYGSNRCTISYLKVTTKEDSFIEDSRLYIGADVKCIMCGKPHNNHNTLYCTNCNNEYRENDSENEDW